MSSSFLHDKIPHSILFPNQPLFCLPSRVFGCVCFVHILTPEQDKLSAKAMKSVFLGYSRLQRGYRYYSPDTHRYFVSTDVTFFENSSMFPITQPPSSNVISLPLLYPIPDTLFVPSATLPRPLQVYTCRPRIDSEPPANSSPMAPSTTSVLSSPADLPIAVRKGTRSSRNPHPIYNFLTYHRLSSPYSAFISTLSSVSLPKTVHEALSHPGWKQAIVEEIVALHSTGTRDLVTLFNGKFPTSCRWVYTIKIDLDGGVDRLKARFVAKGYTQIYGSNYYDTFFSYCQDGLHSSSLLYGYYEILAPISVGHQESISPWRPRRGGIYEATTWICCSRGVWFGMQTTSIVIWPKAVP